MRDNYIGNKCEVCSCDTNLELHHNIPFDTLLHDAIQLLGYKFHEDTGEYSKKELENIKLILIGLQVTSKFTTLCDVCHDEIHSGNQSDISITKIKQIKKDKITKEKINSVLLPYLDEIVNKKLYTDEEKNKLKELFEEVGIRGRTMGINTMNKLLKDIDTKYIIHSRKERSRRNEYRNKQYWMLTLI